MVITEINPIETLRNTQRSPFMLTNTSSSDKYKTAKGSTIVFMPQVKIIKKWNLGVISHVKSRTIPFEKDQPEIKHHLRYCESFKDQPIKIWMGWEIDVVSAYWREVKKRNLCSEQMFEKYLVGKGKKLARNMSVGSMNSIKYRYQLYPNCLGGENQDYFLERIPPYAPKTYFQICFSVIHMLIEMSEELSNPIFYWVDQIYNSGKVNEKRIKQIAKKYGHKVRFTPVIITKKFDRFFVNLRKEPHRKAREFYLRVGGENG